MSASTHTPSDFFGFLDGFQARNLASIQRDIEIHLSEMQSRLTVIRNQLLQVGTAPAAAAADRIMQTENEFRKRDANIAQQMESAGKAINQSLIEDGQVFLGLAGVDTQIKGLLRAYLSAAEVSRHERLIKLGIELVETYQRLMRQPVAH